MSKAKLLQISPRIVEMLSKATIRSWVEAIVELITNCDDSYKTLENEKNKTSGTINIFISRKKGGNWQELRVSDEAEGMNYEELEKALTFAGESSKRKKHKNVRGYFGRGLKETIVALGTGEIITIKDDCLNVVRLWYDKEKKAALYDFVVENEKVNDVLREEYKIKKNGTIVKIEVTNNNIAIPEFETIEKQLKNHISLRDILSSPGRKIELLFEDLRRNLKRKKPIIFEFPKSKKVLDDYLDVPGYKGKVILKLYECTEPFPYKKYSPFNISGILIKTGGAILDNQLFKFENDTASYYFYGDIISPEIDKILNSGDTSILNLSRTGIEWSHNYAQLLMKAIEREIEPIIEKKKKELAKNKKIEINKENQKLFDELSKLFNQIFDQELGEGNIEINPEDVFEERVFIKPELVYLSPGKPRTLCFYAHEKIVKNEGEEVLINNVRNKIFVYDKKIYLERHPKYNNMFLGKFKVRGLKIGDEDIIEGNLGNEKALSEAKVKVEDKETKKRKKKNLSQNKRGNITGFEPNLESNPIQRSFHNSKTGKIVIYTQFPGISKYLGETLENLNTEMGKMLLCEVVCEAVFKKLAKERMRKGEVPLYGQSDADVYQNEIHDLQIKYLNKVYSLVLNYDFENGQQR